MPNFDILKRDETGLSGDFDLKQIEPYAPSDEERIYLGKLDEVLTRLRRDAEVENDRFSQPVIEARAEQRVATIKLLRRDAAEFAGGRLAVAIAADNALVNKGRYLAAVDRISGHRLFVVKEKLDDAKESGAWQGAVDLVIQVAEGLPKPEDAASPEKQALFVAMYDVLTVIKTVCREMSNTETGVRAWLLQHFAPKRAKQKAVRASRLLDEYVRKLAGIGRLGLSGPHTALAHISLLSLKQELVSHEASRIKNSYARRLGLVAVATMIVLLVAYFGVDRWMPNTSWLVGHASFLLAGVGAALGAWLSFSIRNVALSFEQLGTIENDLLSPGLRILFVLGLTFAAYLLFWTDTLGISAGNLKVSAEGLKGNGASAILVGIFCGLSERALATAISGRSATFVGGIAGNSEK